MTSAAKLTRNLKSYTTVPLRNNPAVLCNVSVKELSFVTVYKMRFAKDLLLQNQFKKVDSFLWALSTFLTPIVIIFWNEYLCLTWCQRWELAIETWTQVALKSHTQWLETQPQKTLDLTGTLGLGLLHLKQSFVNGAKCTVISWGECILESCWHTLPWRLRLQYFVSKLLKQLAK